MGNQVENLDPQEYKEEWFKAAILAAKEFQLPNISSTLLARLLSKSGFHGQSGTQCSGPNHSEAIVSSQENPNPPKAQDSSTGNNAPTTDELQLYGSKKRPISSSDQSPDNLGTASTALPHESRYKRNCYKCFTCGATFSGSYALSGHMISHPKRRKIEESLKKRYYSELFFDTTETTLPFASAFRYSSPQNYLQAATSELEKLLI